MFASLPLYPTPFSQLQHYSYARLTRALSSLGYGADNSLSASTFVSARISNQMIVHWFHAFVYIPNCGEFEATSLRTPSLRRAKEFINERIELGAVFGPWGDFERLDPNDYVQGWRNGIFNISKHIGAESVVCGGTHGWSGNSFCAMLVAPVTARDILDFDWPRC